MVRRSGTPALRQEKAALKDICGMCMWQIVLEERKGDSRLDCWTADLVAHVHLVFRPRISFTISGELKVLGTDQ